MGYNTYFHLEIENENFTGIEALQAVKYLLQDEDRFYAITTEPLNFDEIIKKLFYSYLKYKPGNKINKKILLLAQLINNPEPGFIFSNFIENNERTKWYDWKKEMIELSKKSPRILYCLNGVGEEHKDLWKCYFKYGKSQEIIARIEYDPFDEEKLI